MLVAVLPVSVSFSRRPLTTHPSVVGPGGVGQLSPQRGAVPPIGASYASRTYKYGLAGKFGSSAIPSRPRSQKSMVSVLRSVTVVGVVSLRLSYSLITPPF